MVDEYLNIHVRAIDEATGTFNKVTVSTQQQMMAFNNLATSAFSLYNTYDRIQTAEVALDRANLMVAKTTRTLGEVQEKYNTALKHQTENLDELNAAIAQYGADSEEAARAQTKVEAGTETFTEAETNLKIAQDALNVSTERQMLSQGNLNQSMVSMAVSVIPTSITAFASLNTIIASFTGTSLTGMISSFVSLHGGIEAVSFVLTGSLTVALAAAAAAGLLLVGAEMLISNWAKAQYDSLNMSAEATAKASNMMDDYTESIIDNNKAMAAQAMLQSGMSVEEINRILGGNYGATSITTTGAGGMMTSGGVDIHIDMHDNDISSDIDREQLIRDVGFRVVDQLRYHRVIP